MKKTKYFLILILILGILFFLTVAYVDYKNESSSDYDESIFTGHRMEFLDRFTREYLEDCKNVDYNKLDNLAFISDRAFIQNNCSQEFFNRYKSDFNKDYSLDGWGRKLITKRNAKEFNIISYGADGIKGEREDFGVWIYYKSLNLKHNK